MQKNYRICMMKPEYAEFLISEYKKAGLKPEVASVDQKKYIIPCVYIQNCKFPLKSFLTDFFDFMRKDYILYKRYKKKVRYVAWFDGKKKRRLIVPFVYRNSKITASQIADKIFEKASRKYKKAVTTALNLATFYPNMVFEHMVSSKTLSEMLKALKSVQVKQNRTIAVYITGKVGAFLSKNPIFVFGNIFHISTSLLRQKAKKWALKKVLSATVASSVFAALNADV